jgi:hypothetical protein
MRRCGGRPKVSLGEPVRRTVTSVPTELRFDRWYRPLAVAVGLGPTNSELRLEGGSLRVKMGWAFNAEIPLSSIKSAEATNERVFTAGVHVMGSRWLVNGSRKGLVQLTLDPPVPASVWWKSITLKVLILSVTDPDALIAACTAGAR